MVPIRDLNERVSDVAIDGNIRKFGGEGINDNVFFSDRYML